MVDASGDGNVRATGGCECGAVGYRVLGKLRDVSICHCAQCRRIHGHVAAYTCAADADLELTEDRGLKWFRSSDEARRGFCAECGASLFWKSDAETATGIAAGTLDAPTGLKIFRNIFTAHKGDYYDITDGLPAFEDDAPGPDAGD